MKFITSINDRIKDLRLESNLLQSDFEQIGISASTLSDYEKDGSTIPSYVIPKLAEFFGVTTDYLFGLTNIRQPENNSLNGIYFSDNAIEFLKRKDINTKLLSEMIEHPAFKQFLLDAECYVDGHVDAGIDQFSTLFKFAGLKIEKQAPSLEKDSIINGIKRTDELARTFHANLLANDLLPILKDLKANHKKDNDTAGFSSAPGTLKELYKGAGNTNTTTDHSISQENSPEAVMNELVALLARGASASMGLNDSTDMENMIHRMMESQETKNIRTKSELFEPNPRKRRSKYKTDESKDKKS